VRSFITKIQVQVAQRIEPPVKFNQNCVLVASSVMPWGSLLIDSEPQPLTEPARPVLVVDLPVVGRRSDVSR
jgi:hypothetical protein